MRKSGILAAILLLSPAISQAKSLEELLVEKGVITRNEAESAGSADASKVYWDKGTRVEFPGPGFTAGFATLIQTAYTFTDNDEDRGGKNTSSFDVKKARVILSGSALHKEFEYFLQGDFVGTSTDGVTKSAALKDAYIRWNACENASIQLGQYKTPIGRQFNNADAQLQFAEVTQATKFFALGRDVGAAGKVTSEDNEWVLEGGIFNGSSDGEGENASGRDTNHTGVVRLRWNALGKIDAFSESDVEYSEELGLTTAIAYAYQDAKNAFAENGPLVGNDVHTMNADVSLKYQGASLAAEFFYQDANIDDVDDDVKAKGGYVQAGYFLDPKVLEVALRGGYIDCDNGAAGGQCSGNDELTQGGVSLNYYFWKHFLKAQVGYDFFNENPVVDGPNTNTGVWTFQVTGYF